MDRKPNETLRKYVSRYIATDHSLYELAENIEKHFIKSLEEKSERLETEKKRLVDSLDLSNSVEDRQAFKYFQEIKKLKNQVNELLQRMRYVCASCGQREVVRVDEERTRCNACGWITDFYEVLKATDEKDGAKQ